MKLYIIRVELHGATETTYQILHSAMADLGFHRELSHVGNTYQLPTAEYAINSNLNAAAILKHVKGAANGTGKGSWILVVEGGEVALDLPIAR